MKQIIILITIMYFGFSWADYETCVQNEQYIFSTCTEHVGETWGRAKIILFLVITMMNWA